MSIDILWKLFEKTGNIYYYNLLKSIKGDIDGKKQYDEKSSNNRSDC